MKCGSPDISVGSHGYVRGVTFLIAAGKANEAYARDVLRLQVTQEGRAIIGGQLPIATQLHYIAMGFGPAPGQTGQELLQSAYALAYCIVTATASIVAAGGLDPGYTVWSSTWGVAGMEEYRDSPAQMAASWIGLNEVWYDAVNVFMLKAAQQAGLAP